MRAIIAYEVRRFLSARLVLLVLGCGVYSLAERRDYEFSHANFVLTIISDHYYLTFFMTLVYFYLLSAHLENDRDYVQLRVRSYIRYYSAKAAALTVNMAVFAGIQLAVIAMVGIGLSHDMSFPAEDPSNLRLELLTMFSEYFHTPWQATAVSVIYMIAGLSVLSLLFMTLHHFLGRRKLVWIFVVLYFLMVFAMKRMPELTRLPFVIINNYVIFMYNLTYPYALVVSFVSLAIIVCGCFLVIRKHWNRKPTLRIPAFSLPGIAPYYLRRLLAPVSIAAMVASVGGLLLWRLLQILDLPGSTREDYLLQMFWGHGQGQFQPLEFAAMLMMNIVPLYLIAVFLEREQLDHSLMLTFRLRSKRQWVLSILGVILLFLLGYTVLLAGGSLLAAWLGGLPGGGITQLAGELSGAAAHVIYGTGIKFLELLLWSLILLTVYLTTRRTTAGFVVIIMLYGLYLLPFTWLRYVPAGISSLARQEPFAADPGTGLSVSFIVLYLSIIIVCLVCYVLFSGYRRRFI
ncbi:hypothetical protein [Paenibacillus sp. 1P07SE]|uniref:hypothetical protein n=1 Tax=Paenibacillus sp. 1P07SE TaxID=3132209 RepID=UPI0039A42600